MGRRSDCPVHGAHRNLLAGTALRNRFRGEIDALERRWRDEPDVNGIFNGLIASLGRRVLDAAEADVPGRDHLAQVLECLREQMADPDADPDDVAEEVIYAMQDMTPEHAGEVVYDPIARYPYKPVCSCGHSFWGYAAEHAAQSILDAHLAERP